MQLNLSNVSWPRLIVVAGLIGLLFVLIALDEGLGRAGVVVLALVGVIVQGVALVAVLAPVWHRQRPSVGALLALGACILVNAGLLFTSWSRLVWPVGAFSLIFACAVVFAMGMGASRKDQ